MHGRGARVRARSLGGAPAHAQGSHPWLDPTLLAAAKGEGSVTVYTSTNEREGLPLFKIFEDATGIKVHYIRAGDAMLMSRTAIEMRAGQPSFDIALLVSGAQGAAADAGAIRSARRRSTSSRTGARSRPALARRLRQLQRAGLQHAR